VKAAGAASIAAIVACGLLLLGGTTFMIDHEPWTIAIGMVAVVLLGLTGIISTALALYRRLSRYAWKQVEVDDGTRAYIRTYKQT
jgi:hypothetical protein